VKVIRVHGILSDADEKPATDPKRSILKNKIICLECGAEFKQISAKHLATHDLTPKEYRKRYGSPVAGQIIFQK